MILTGLVIFVQTPLSCQAQNIDLDTPLSILNDVFFVRNQSWSLKHPKLYNFQRFIAPKFKPSFMLSEHNIVDVLGDFVISGHFANIDLLPFDPKVKIIADVPRRWDNDPEHLNIHHLNYTSSA